MLEVVIGYLNVITKVQGHNSIHSSLLGFRDFKWQKNGTIIFNVIVLVFIWYSIMKCLTFLCFSIFHHHGDFFFPPLMLFCCVVHVMECGCASLKSSHLAITYFSCSLTTLVRSLFVIIFNCALPLLFMWCCLVAQVHRGVLLMTFCCALLSSLFFSP